MNTRRSHSVSIKREPHTTFERTDSICKQPTNATSQETLKIVQKEPEDKENANSNKVDKEKIKEKSKTPRFFDSSNLFDKGKDKEKESSGRKDKVKTISFDTQVLDSKGKDKENSARREKANTISSNATASNNSTTNTPRIEVKTIGDEGPTNLRRKLSTEKDKYLDWKENNNDAKDNNDKDKDAVIREKSTEKLDYNLAELKEKEQLFETKEQEKERDVLRSRSKSSPRKVLGKLTLSSKSSTKKISMYLEKGYRADTKGNVDKAMINYDKALTLDPTCASAWNKKGFSYYKIKKYQESIDCYEKAINFEPDNATYWNNKGGSYLALEDYTTSLVCFEKATELRDRYVIALNNKGIALRNLERYDEAMKCHYRTIQIAPNVALSWNQLGKVKYAIKEYQEALDCFDRAMEIDPNYYQAHYGKAIALKDLGKHEEAMKLFDIVLKLNPNYENVWEMVPIVPPKEMEIISPSKAMRRLSLEENSTQSTFERLNINLDSDDDII